MFPATTRIAVLGAGLAGLSASYRLKLSGIDHVVLETAPVAGGVVKTITSDGMVMDFGPNTMQERHTEVGALIEALGLSEKRQFAAPAARRRFIVRDGRLAEAPTSPASFLNTRLLSIRGKARLLAEPFVRRGGIAGETVEQFASRRFGPEAAAYLFDPFVSGIYAGRASDLAVGAAFPRLVEIEKEFGSVVLGGIRSRPTDSERRPDRRSFSFRGGMATLTKRLAEGCQSLQVNTAVTAIAKTERGWQIDWRRGSEAGTLLADAAISTLPPYVYATMPVVPPPLKTLAATLRYVPVAVVALSLPRTAVAHPLNGFGVLVPSSEAGRGRGALFTSTLFPDRAPSDRVLITAFVGGSRFPEDVEKGDDEMLAMVSEQLGGLLGFNEKPALHGVQRWPKAIPQYDGGFLKAQAIADDFEAASPSFSLAGNYRSGVAAADAIKSGLDAADAVSKHLGYATPALPLAAR
ncbi:protoporphyrinogen oxidase [soil metagenome]